MEPRQRLLNLELELDYKMKKIPYILILGLLLACDKEDAGDCFQTEGATVQKEVTVTPFEKILVNRDVELIVNEGIDFQVVIETGENLLNDVKAVVVNNELRLTDNNTCNYVRDYGITKIYVTAPNIIEIRSSTQYDISSDGILNYDEIKLICEDYNEPEGFTVGDFRMHINSNKLSVVANNISSFYLSGQVNNLFVGFYSGAGRFHGEFLTAENVNVFHRGSNDMFVNPQQSLTGELRGTGDLISINNPTIVDVERFYTGQLIFQ